MNLLKYITFFLILLTGNVYSKNLPPGSGSSVPANILIMLDRTFSMYQPAIKDAGVDTMFNPMAIAQDPLSKHYFVAQVDRQGVVLWDASTSTKNKKHSWGAMKKARNRCDPPTSFNGNRPYDIFAMEVYDKYIYTAKLRDDVGREITQYDARTTATAEYGCKEYKTKSPRLNGSVTIDIQNGIFYSFSKNVMYAKDLSTNPNFLTAPKVCITQAYNSKLKEVGEKGSALAVDKDNNYLYLHNKNDNKIYSFKIKLSGCVETIQTGSWTNPCGMSLGMATHPDDPSILYSSGRDSNKICKMKLNSSRSSIDTSSTKMVGIGDAYETSVAGSIYFYKPLYLAFNDSGQLLVANSERIEITVLDEDLNFERVFGLSGVSRLRGAVDAISAVVSDSALTEGALFGLGLWSKNPGSGSFTGWNPSAFGGRGAGIPCNGETCLLVKIDSDGAAKINDFLKFPISLFRQTDARGFAKLSTEYLNSSFSPIDTSIPCQNNYIIVIGDGGWKSGDPHNNAIQLIENLRTVKKVKSIMVAYGNSLKASQLTKFNQMAVAGGTGAAIVALTANDLKVQLQSIIATIIAENLSYTAPAITGEIETGGSLYQAQFDYFANQEWQGSLKRTKINADGNVTDTPLWNAKDELPTPGNRKIWSIIPGTDYKTDYKNFTDTFASLIHNELFQATGNTLKDYHNDSDANKLTTGRCGQFGANNSIVADGIDDEITGLINFIRGEDYFDFDGDCDLTEPRNNYLADIYNSQIVVVGKPEADTGYLNNNQEAYWRSKHGYQTWKDSLSSRMEVVYAGANNGILHAFNAQTGKELWGFVPPLIAGKLPLIINSGLNKSTGGGSVPIFAVDGSPVVHDMYFISPLDSSPKWHTIMMIPYGRGGAGFSVLDITDPNSPLHLYSILNDPVRGKVHHVNHMGVFEKYDYQSSIFEMNNFKEVQQADQNYEDNASVSNTCNNSGSTSCYKGTSLTLNEVLSTSSISNAKVFVNGSLSSASFSTVGSTTKVNFGENITYNADPNSSVLNSTVGITIINPISSSGIDYNYRFLAETWSSPRIIRLPNHGAGDTNDEDDIYVAVMGGGYGVNQPGLGSNLLVINLENGKLLKQIDIADLQGSGTDISGKGIVNSVPSTPVVITADTSTAINFRGALVYVNDLEGKITKINLSNMEDDRNESATPTPISLYDQTTLFTAGSTSQNNRYMFHSMDATIGNQGHDFWLFAGTGNYTNLNDAGVADKNAVDNLLIGIKDKTYPKFQTVDAAGINGLTKCKDTTNDSTGANCPEDADLGWYIKLDPSTTSARKKVTAEPTVSRGVVYFPIYKPNDVNICNLGDAFICAADDECGTNISSDLGTNTGATAGEKCLHVGNGALSKIVVFGNHVYANIAGETTTKKDLVVITATGSDMSSFRLDWRENF